VPYGNTLALVGGEIQVTGGTLTAKSGHITMASAASPGEVALGTASTSPVRTASVASLGPVTLDGGARLDVSGSQSRGSGTVTIRSGRLVMQQATITADTPSLQPSASAAVDIHTTNELHLTRTAISANVSSTGAGGDIRIQAGAIHLENASTLRARGSRGSAGTRGNITIAADSVNITGGSRLDTNTDGAGPGGNITVTAMDAVTIAGRDSANLQSGLVSDTTSTVMRGVWP